MFETLLDHTARYLVPRIHFFDGSDDSDSDDATDSEVTRYLAQKVAPGSWRYDVLKWWKQNANQANQYPILSRMAKDYLAIQCSSKDTEGAFSKGRRQMPYFRASLKRRNFKAQMLVNSGESLGLF